MTEKYIVGNAIYTIIGRSKKDIDKKRIKLGILQDNIKPVKSKIKSSEADSMPDEIDLNGQED